MYEAGIRFENDVYVSFKLDISNGDMTVALELIDNDGNKFYPTGEVVWNE